MLAMVNQAEFRRPGPAAVPPRPVGRTPVASRDRRARVGDGGGATASRSPPPPSPTCWSASTTTRSGSGLENLAVIREWGQRTWTEMTAAEPAGDRIAAGPGQGTAVMRACRVTGPTADSSRRAAVMVAALVAAAAAGGAALLRRPGGAATVAPGRPPTHLDRDPRDPGVRPGDSAVARPAGGLPRSTRTSCFRSASRRWSCGTKAGVGQAVASYRDCEGDAGRRVRAFELFAASDPERAHGFDRRGFFREALRVAPAGVAWTAYFGAMTSWPEKTLSEARKSADGPQPHTLRGHRRPLRRRSIRARRSSTCLPTASYQRPGRTLVRRSAAARQSHEPRTSLSLSGTAAKPLPHPGVPRRPAGEPAVGGRPPRRSRSRRPRRGCRSCTTASSASSSCRRCRPTRAAAGARWRRASPVTPPTSSNSVTGFSIRASRIRLQAVGGTAGGHGRRAARRPCSRRSDGKCSCDRI